MTVHPLHPLRNDLATILAGRYAYALMCGRLAANLESILDAKNLAEQEVATRNARKALSAYERLNNTRKARR